MSNCKSMGNLQFVLTELYIMWEKIKLLCFYIIRFSKMKSQMEFIYTYIHTHTYIYMNWFKKIILSGKGLSANEPISQIMSKFSSVQSLSHVWLFVILWTTAHQAALSITNSWSLPKLMSIKSVMPSNHLILCRPLLLPLLIFPRIRVFSDESVLHIKWPKYWSCSFSISLSNEYSELISFRID